MESLAVECLRCGKRHTLTRWHLSEISDSECPRCGYVGWAHASSLDEESRSDLRARPIEFRRVGAAA